MAENQKAYKKTEKWWLGLVVLFYVLYNLPGVPSYGNPEAAIIHGVLTIIPMWIISYAGMIIVFRQRKLNKVEKTNDQNH
ncbi:MAG: hypothetical protein HQK55_10265 [Deltaproteobacteria bacterium]|nr:hypothetical protein [Deltaproteobacteria bacterium]